MNITFPSEVLTIAQCHARGFNIREHVSPNSSLKVFTLEVPFTDPAVLQSVRFNFSLGAGYYCIFNLTANLSISLQRGMGFIVYSLHLTFGLLVLNEFAPFSHTVYLEATLEDKGLYGCLYTNVNTQAWNVCNDLAPAAGQGSWCLFNLSAVPPSISGSCDYQNFYVLVEHGTSDFNFHTMVGKRLLTPGLAQQYGFMENGTHFNLVVPFAAPDVAFEVFCALL